MARPADPTARASLISAARAELVKKGLRGARIEDITAACGLSKGAFYLHFASKEALFSELLDKVTEAFEALARERLELLERFFAEPGRLDEGSPSERAERHQQIIELETELNLRSLELMWDHRDVIHVLLRGSQGTEFEPLFWLQLDREVERVATDFRRMQSACACRLDVSPELFGSVIVGTYSLLIQQMSRMRQKPDLARWARDMQLLFSEGYMPRTAEPTPVRRTRAASARSSPRRTPTQAVTRKTSRKR